jgi:two-component system response regulator (stage 0 sporulation protein F)
MEEKIKILIVDDEKDFTQPMAFWFKMKGYQVIVAHEGKTALEMIEKENPNIVFLDLNMPVMDGVETLKRIRETHKDLPVIIISAYVDREKIKEMEPHQISGVFYKENDFSEGLSLLESVLRTHKKLKK